MVGWLLAAILSAQDPPVKLSSAAVDKPQAQAGDLVKLRVKLSVDPGLHIYSLTIDPNKGRLPLFAVDAPAKIDGPLIEPPPGEFEGLPIHEGVVEFVLPIRLPLDAKGPFEIKGRVSGDACDDKRCREFAVDFAAKLNVLPRLKPKMKVLPEVKIVASKLDKAEAKVGETVKLTLELSISSPYHIYPAGYKVKGAATQLEFEGPFEVRGEVEEKPNAKFDGEDVFEKTATIIFPILVKDGVKPGPIDLKASLKFQACDDKNCYPGDLPVALSLTIVEGRVEKEDLTSNLGGFLIACVLGGLISLVMPCVYPLVPITLKFFITQSEGSRAKSFGLAVMYGLGIIISFTGLGLLLSVLLGKDGAQTFSANPWVNLSIATLFFVLALSFFGLFELKLPGFITNRVAGGPPKMGAIGAFGLGLIFAVVSFTCTFPIAATLLAMAATGQAAWALFGMIVYSGTMAVPFLMFGFFPDLIKKLPKSGGWLHTITVSVAFLELALATKYLANAGFTWGWSFLPRTVVLAIWVMVCSFTATYLLDFWRFPEDQKQEHTGAGRLIWAFVFGGLGVFLSAGLVGRHLSVFEVLLPIDESVHAGIGILRTIVLAVAITVLLFAATWFLDLWRFRGSERKEHIGIARMFGAFGLSTVGAFLVAGLLGRTLGAVEKLLPADETVGKEIVSTMHYNSLDEGLQVAKREGKPIFLEFTGFS